MESFRRGFGKLFSAKATRVLVAPFLPEGITSQTFDELLKAVNGVAECTDVSVISRSEEVEKRCNELSDAATELGTNYSESLILDLLATLQRLVRSQVAAAGFADPAHLSVAVRPKRYPFSHPQAPVTVRIDITNKGAGQAQDVSVEIEGGGAISFDETVKAVGLLGPGTRQVQFHGIVVDGLRSKTVSPRQKSTKRTEPGSRTDVLMIKITWLNPDRSEDELEEIETLKDQPGSVPWSDLALEEPYRLEPVTDPKDFVGREAAVRSLAKIVLQSGNARIQGEKRVGKTSLAYAVRAAVDVQKPQEYTFLQLESGDFNAHTPEETVARVGQLIVERARRADRRLSGLRIPDFTPGLATITDFFADAYDMAPDRKFVIVLDEFDALPHGALYKHEPVGDAFFQTLRSLGGKPNVGFVLIGAERMQWIMAVHGQALNKFKLVPVDYFTEDQVEDYAELIRMPVSGRLQFADEAIESLHAVTAGNPWMTKLLLSDLFERQVERRDQDVQADDVTDAIVHALPKFDAASFQHFWDDAIQGDVQGREHVSAMRRRVLLAFARCLQGIDDVTEESVVQQAANFNVDEPTARDVIRGLLDRSILRTDERGALTFRVPLFERWLAEHGAQEIILGTGDDDTLIRRQRSIEEMRPKADELVKLAENWRTYRGEDIRAEQIGGWLSQFGGPSEQRLMMPVLEGLQFYTRRQVDEHLRELHQFVLRELAARNYEYTLSGKQRNRSDFLVCGLEGGGSGAAHLVKRYRDENGIYTDCAVDPGNVRRVLDAAKQEIRAVLVLDDFIGTGHTAAKRLKELSAAWTSDAEWPEAVDVFLLAISGFDDGVERVEKALPQVAWPVTLRVADMLSSEDRCFSDESRFFGEETARTQAEELSARYGAMLVPDNPLGFGRSEAAVCFEYRCPNNTLPVLWAASENWSPLFPRL